MKPLSPKCLAIAPSITLEIDAKAKRMKADGQDVIGFGAGEPDFDTPAFIKNAAKEALDKGLTKYTPASGTLDLKKAVCAKLKRQNHLAYEPSQIIISNGAKHSLFNAFAAILCEGDEVIVPAPYWVTYPELIQFHGGIPKYVETEEKEGFAPTIEAIRAAVSAKTKAIIVNSPSNPCGAVYSKTLLEEIAQLAKDFDFYIVSDEIYEELIYDGEKHYSIAQVSDDAKERTILVNGWSKAYAMTGWRLGYTASNAAIAKAMGNLQSHATSNPNTIAQYAGCVALNGPRNELEQMVEAFARRRVEMVDLINKMPLVSCLAPKGAFYIMMNISQTFGKIYAGKKIENSMDFCNALLDAKKVAFVPGIAFGADDYCRISYATSDENIRRGMARVSEFLSELL